MVNLNKLLLLGSINLSAALAEGYASSDKYLHMIVDRIPKSSNLVKRGEDDPELPMLDTGDLYMAEIEVGSNNQKVYVQIDTGSSDFWVVASDDIYCDKGTAASLSRRDGSDDDYESEDFNCSTYGTFDASESTSFTTNDTTFYIIYGDGTHANGTWGQDTLTFGGVSVKDMNLAVCNDTTITPGLLGIGLIWNEATYSGEDPYTYANLPVKLVQEGIIEKAAYSIYLHANHSELLFGAVDTAKFDGELVQFPVVNSGFLYGYDEPTDLAITLNGLSFYNNNTGSTDTIMSGAAPALLDTGTTYTSFPEDMLNLMVEILGYQYYAEYELYGGECSVADDMVIKFDFQNYIMELALSDFLVGAGTSDDSSLCFFTAQNVDNYTIILGDKFLKHIYMVADLEDLTISIAKVVDTDDSSIEVIKSSIPSATSASGTNVYASTNSDYVLNTSATVISQVSNTRSASKNAGTKNQTNLIGLLFALFAFI